jgi:hypothetical protein
MEHSAAVQTRSGPTLTAPRMPSCDSHVEVVMLVGPVESLDFMYG